MKLTCFCLLSIGLSVTLFSQRIHPSMAESDGKPILDIGVFSKWNGVVNPSISNDGKYFLFTKQTNR